MIAALKERLSGLKAFGRGIHPPHRKYTEATPIELFVPSGQVLLPLVQHIGAACEPSVKPKTEVKVGDKIADATAFVTAPIHATINGKIAMSAITPIPGGRRVPAIPIKPDADTPVLPDGFMPAYLSREWDGVEPTAWSSEEICDKIREAGLVGLGGATFPTHIKLRPNKDRPIDTLILNGCECEPYLTADHRMMVECPEAMVTGMLIAAHAAGVQKMIIAIEANKPDAIGAMRKAAAGKGDIEVAVCATKYPMGGERQLIAAVTGRTVPSAPKGLPLDVGCVVINVATAHTIAHAVVHGRPLTHRVITITGRGVNKPGNYLAPIGTMLNELLDGAAGGLKEDAYKVLAGGPMMGPTLPNLDIPVVKGTGGLTIMTEAETAHWNESSCIRCGRCIDNCPLLLSPTKIAHAVKHRDYEYAAHFDMMACIECGCCSYICPAQIPLTQYIRAGKGQMRVIAAQKKAKEDAAKAKEAATAAPSLVQLGGKKDGRP